MNIVRRTVTVVFALLVMFQMGCASVNKAPAAADSEAKKFSPKAGMAQVYVYRNETLGAAISMPITVNGKLAGTTGPNSYFKFDLPPGQHTITSQGETSKLTVATEPGKNYFVWQEVKMGVMSANSKLQLVSDAEGKKAVLECSRIESTVGSESMTMTTAASAPTSATAPTAAPVASTALRKSNIRIDDVAAVPYLSAKDREAYTVWLTRPSPKAFAIGPKGHYWPAWGPVPGDPTLPVEVKARANAGCSKNAGVTCKLYAVDNDVVWEQ
jgi:Protein of unknown function (DUF2846)